MANSPAVADLTVELALQVLRPTRQASAMMAAKGFDINIAERARQIDNMWWGCVGAGTQVRYLIPLLIAHRCKNVMIYHPQMTSEKLENLLDRIVGITFQPTLLAENRFIHKVNSSEVSIIGTRDLGELLSSSDVVSLHMPATTKEESKYGIETIGLISKKSSNLQKMKHGSILINVARGALVDESDVLDALNSGQLGAIASDVIHPNAEKNRDPRLSPLWSQFCKNESETKPYDTRSPSILLTPHIGGATREAISEVARDVIFQLLSELQVPGELYSILKL